MVLTLPNGEPLFCFLGTIRIAHRRIFPILHVARRRPSLGINRPFDHQRPRRQRPGQIGQIVMREYARHAALVN